MKPRCFLSFGPLVLLCVAWPCPAVARPLAAPAGTVQCGRLEQPGPRFRQQAASIDALLARYADYGFSGSVLVAKGRHRLAEKGYGWADSQRRVPNGAETLYDVASLAKTFTAAAILQLEAEGRLSTRDPLSRFLPGLSPDKQAITIHHLLTHMSGYPHDSGHVGIVAADTREEFLRKAATGKLAHEPGSKYEYSNLGYGLLAHVVEQVSGRTWQSYVRDRLLNRAGLGNSYLYGERLPRRAVLASPYLGETMVDPKLQPPLVHEANNPYLWGKYTLGAVGVLATVGDLRRWWCALNGDRLLPPGQRSKLFAIQAADQGYGWNIKVENESVTRIHRGGLRGSYQSMLAYYPAEDALIVFALNRNSASSFWAGYAWRNLEKAVKGQAPTLPPAIVALPPAAVERFAGTYVLPTGGTFRVRSAGGILHIGAEGQDAVDPLAFPGRADAAQLDAARSRSLRAVAALAGNDPDSIGRLGSLKPDQLRQLRAKWSEWTEGIGGLSSHEAIGSTPGSGFIRTFVRLKGSKGEKVIRLLWNPAGNLLAWGDDIPLPVEHQLWPRSETGFIHYGFDSDRTIGFEFAPDGSLVVEAKGALWRASRAGGPSSAPGGNGRSNRK